MAFSTPTQECVLDHLKSYEDYEDTVEFSTECESIYDKDKKDAKKQKWKYSKRVIVVTKFRIFVFKKNFFGKGISLEKEHHLLELVEIIGEDERDVISLKFSGEVLLTLRDSRSGLCVKKIRETLRTIYYGIAPKYDVKISVPDKRLEELDATFVVSPAGCFKESYLAYCNQRKAKPRFEIIDYVADCEREGIYELDLTKCPGIDPKSEIYVDIISVGHALAHNTYFKSVVLAEVGQKDAFVFASAFLKYNSTITKVIVRNTYSECANELGDALFENTSHQFQIMDFSGNSLTAASIVPFSRSIRNCLHLITVLSLRNCNLSCRSLSALIHAFKANWGLSLGFEELDLSHNGFDDTTTANFNEWFTLMKSHSNIRRLGLSNTNIDGVSVIKAIRYSPKLEYIDLSGNSLEKVTSNVLEESFFISKNLKVLNVANTSMHADAIITLFRCLLNLECKDVALNISGNSLGSKNAALIADVIRIMKGLKVLDISNNSLGKGCEAIVLSIHDNVSVLIMDDNLNTTSSNDLTNIGLALVKLLENNPNLIKLSLTNAKYKSKLKIDRLESFFRALSINNTLTELDISDNSMKDATFSLLCKSLRDNTGLKSFKFDGNHISHSGFQSLLRSLTHNNTLTSLGFPAKDVKGDSRLHHLFLEISRLADRNGDIVVIEDPFQFHQNWNIPAIPAPNLCKVPQYLIDQSPVTDDEVYQAIKNESIPTEAPPEPPTSHKSTRTKSKKLNDNVVPPPPEKPPTPPSSPPPPAPSMPMPPPTSPVPPPPSHVPPPPSVIPPPPTSPVPPPPSQVPPPNVVPPPPKIVSTPPTSVPSAPPPPPVSSSDPSRSGLLQSIEAFKKGKLKKAVTVDKSAPRL